VILLCKERTLEWIESDLSPWQRLPKIYRGHNCLEHYNASIRHGIQFVAFTADPKQAGGGNSNRGHFLELANFTYPD